jgi:propanol-preferring alcohol dehydrogenase
MISSTAINIGIYGFGAAAHILIQVANFTREGDNDAQKFARQLGAVWAGNSQVPYPN